LRKNGGKKRDKNNKNNKWRDGWIFFYLDGYVHVERIIGQQKPSKSCVFFIIIVLSLLVGKKKRTAQEGGGVGYCSNKRERREESVKSAERRRGGTCMCTMGERGVKRNQQHLM